MYNGFANISHCLNYNYIQNWNYFGGYLICSSFYFKHIIYYTFVFVVLFFFYISICQGQIKDKNVDLMWSNISDSHIQKHVGKILKYVGAIHNG